MPIAEKTDPRAYFADTSPNGGQGEKMDELKSQCGWVVDGIDSIVEKVTGWSLREELLKDLAGDFVTIGSMQVAWSDNVTPAIQAVADNYSSLADQIEGQWTGETIDAAVKTLRNVSEKHAHTAEGTKLIAECLGNIINISIAAGQIVAMAINVISDIVTQILADAATPVIGWAAGAIEAPGDACKIINWIHKGLEAIEKIRKAITEAAPILKRLPEILKTIAEITKVIKTIAQVGAIDAQGHAASKLGGLGHAAFGSGA